MPTLLTLRPGQSVPSFWSTVETAARTQREAGGHPDEVIVRFREVEHHADTLSARFEADTVLAAHAEELA